MISILFLFLTSWDIKLAWDANPPEDNVTFYNVYENGKKIQAVPGDKLITEIKDRVDGETYEYYLTAENGAGLESLPSDKVIYFAPLASLSMDRKSMTLTVSPNAEYFLEASHDLKAWVEIERIISETKTKEVAIDESGSYKFFRVRRNKPTLAPIMKSFSAPASATIEMPPMPPMPPEIKPKKRFKYKKPRTEKGAEALTGRR